MIRGLLCCGRPQRGICHLVNAKPNNVHHHSLQHQLQTCPKKNQHTMLNRTHWSRNLCLPQASERLHKLVGLGQARFASGSVRGLRTSARHSAPPLLAMLVMKPIAKLTAVITGRAFRQWWKALPPNKRDVFMAALRRNKYQILGALAGAYGVTALYYYTHVKTTPITNRRRFIAFTDSQFMKIAEENYKEMLQKYDGKFVPTSHPVYAIVANAAQRLIQGNRDLPQVQDRSWTIHIVDESVKNAFVLPNGEIFVFTGILQAVDNQEQLAAVLAHEMAHVVLSHNAELVSFFNFVDLLLIVVLGAIWAILPNDGIAMVATWFKNRVVQMPYNRNLESEADEVGLQMAAKGCFDVRESQVFWEGMVVRSEAEGEDNIADIELLSTHPNHQNRANRLAELMPGAIHLREMCKCPPLPERDPMVSVERLRKKLHDKSIQQSPQEVVVKPA